MASSTLNPTIPQSRATIASELRLRDIVKTLPREVFIKDPVKAWTAVALNVLVVALGYWGLTIAPWFLLPPLWILTGTALTGFFVIGHDCAHRSFSNSRWVNDIVGHIFMMPLIYPFHSWRVLHNYHHKHTNKLEVDNAWQPFQAEFYDNLPTVAKWGYQLMRGRLWWMASILHWAVLHFNWQNFEGKDREKVRLSVIVVVAFAAVTFPLLIATGGIWGFVKFWLLPWLVYHFWMSTFTLVHHTMPDIIFTPSDRWNEAEAQLSGTVHCDYPGWVEFLCHDINVHVPHHISTAIPFYNLRPAHSILKAKWGSYIYERQFSWALMKEITDQCHIYDPEKGYKSFKEYHAQP